MNPQLLTYITYLPIPLHTMSFLFSYLSKDLQFFYYKRYELFGYQLPVIDTRSYD